MHQLPNFIKSKISIEDNDLQIILSKFKQRTVEKGKFILRKGQTANQYYFIKSGGLRFSFGEYETRDTCWVVFENEFFTEMSSLMPQKPTRFNIEAIEETDLLYIDKEDMDSLYKQFHCWQEFVRKTWERFAVMMIDQIVSFQTKTAEERYLELLETPDLVQRIPVKHLSSLLGVTPNALSRIRKNIK